MTGVHDDRPESNFVLRVGFLATASDRWGSHYKGSFAALLVASLAQTYRV